MLMGYVVYYLARQGLTLSRRLASAKTSPLSEKERRTLGPLKWKFIMFAIGLPALIVGGLLLLASIEVLGLALGALGILAMLTGVGFSIVYAVRSAEP